MRCTEGKPPTRCGTVLLLAVPPSWPCVSVSEPKPRSEPSFMSNSACSHLVRVRVRVRVRGLAVQTHRRHRLAPLGEDRVREHGRRRRAVASTVVRRVRHLARFGCVLGSGLGLGCGNGAALSLYGLGAAQGGVRLRAECGSGPGAAQGLRLRVSPHLAHRLSADVLVLVGKLDVGKLGGDRHAILDDLGRAEGLLDHHVATALRVARGPCGLGLDVREECEHDHGAVHQR